MRLFPAFCCFFLLFVFLFSCLHTSNQRLSQPLDREILHKTVYIAANFTPKEEDNIINAIKNWECSTNYLISFNIQLHAQPVDYLRLEGSNDLAILKANSQESVIKEADKTMSEDEAGNRKQTVGLYLDGDGRDINRILLVEDRLNEQLFEPTVLHELGHAFHLSHTASKKSIMYPLVDSGAGHITHEDLLAFCNLYWCDAEEMRVCK